MKQMLSNTLRLNFTYLKIIYILYPRYHLKTNGYILKKKQKSKRGLYSRDYTITHNEIKMKMKKGLIDTT